MSADPPLGAIASVPSGRGIVRFCGVTSFAPGKWVGIELAVANGKNDGAIGGVSYFHCKPNHGVFVRPSQVKVVEDPKPSPAPPTPSASRPGLSHKRTSSVGIPRSGSLLPPASPRSGSPARPGGANVASPLAARTPPVRTLSRPSALQESEGRSPPIPATRLQPSPRSVPVTLSHTRRPSVVTASIPVAPVSTPSPLSDVPLRQPELPPTRPITPEEPVPPTPPPPPPPAPAVDDKELQELRAKIRVLEAKREDDARRVRELETRYEEAERFVAVRPKLQAKLAQQQTDLIAARRELADAQQLAELAETRHLDSQEQLEMAALDKEVAEERAEAVELELEEVKERLASLEVELDVLKGGGGGGDDGDQEIKASLPYIQLEKQNERLKEALVRLRDMSQETDQDQKRRLVEMEKDLAGVDDLQSQFDSALIKLSNAEVQIEDLKLQLDDAMGAEEMLVQLTERNLMLGEKIEEMRITIEDLEALKELNDELEENHVDTERALQAELDARDLAVHAQARRAAALEDACADADETIAQFRALVLALQQDLDGLRAQSASATEESARAASQSAAMRSLNLKLQSSATKSQARAIDFELKNIEAKEAQQLLSIVQPYLPQAYVESDMDATNCYIFFQRLGMKMDLINTVVAHAHGLPDSLSGPVTETLVGICELRSRIFSVATLCRRFAAVLRRCDAAAFLAIGRVFAEIAPLEKRVDMHLSLLRREEFRESECVSDVAKIQGQFEHLAEAYFTGFEHDLGEREQGMACSLDYDLDMFTAAVGLAKTSIQAIMKEDDIVLDNGGADFEADLFAPIQAVLQKVKSAQAQSRKLTRRLDEVVGDSAAIKAHFIPRLNAVHKLLPELTDFAISFAQAVIQHVSDARSAKSSFQLRKVLSLAQQTASASVGKGRADSPEPWQAVEEYVDQILHEINAVLPVAMEAENVMKITGKAPWVARVADIKALAAVNVEAEHKLAQATDELQSLARTLRAREQAAQEAAVKTELLERRLEASKRTADALAQLEEALAKARVQEATLEEALQQLQAEMDALEKENAKLKAAAAANPERQAETQRPEAETVAVEGSLETSYLLEQLEALRGTVRFLRTENSYLKGQDMLREIEALPPLPAPAKRPDTPPLEPSVLADTDSDADDGPRTPPTLRALATETKQLYRDALRFAAAPRVVDLSAVNARRVEAAAGGPAWMSRKQMPAQQMLARKAEAERLRNRVRGLVQRTNVLDR